LRAEEFGIAQTTSVTETRKYAYHRKIERNRTAARQAKKFHGTRCQACNLDFAERYGEIGKGFIEAHHLKAISTLEEGVAVQYDCSPSGQAGMLSAALDPARGRSLTITIYFDTR
jgi:5-methylcytosine-specific restriction enzyme A